MQLALGLIETIGLIGAIEAADAMAKAANVKIVDKEKSGGGLVTIKIVGDVAAVKSAVEAGALAASRVGNVVSTHIIPHPSDEIEPIISKNSVSSNRTIKKKKKGKKKKVAKPTEASLFDIVDHTSEEANIIIPHVDNDESKENKNEAELVSKHADKIEVVDEQVEEIVDAKSQEESSLESNESENDLVEEESIVQDITNDIPKVKPTESAEETEEPDEVDEAETSIDNGVDTDLPDVENREDTSSETKEESVEEIDSVENDTSEIKQEESIPSGVESVEISDDEKLLKELVEEETSNKSELDTKVGTIEQVAVQEEKKEVTKHPEINMAELEILNVHALRKRARSFDDFPIKGRDISKANRGLLLDYFKSLI